MHWHIPPMRAMMMTTGRFHSTSMHVGWQTLWPDRVVYFHRLLDHRACVCVFCMFDVLFVALIILGRVL